MEERIGAPGRMKPHELPQALRAKQARWRFWSPVQRLERDCRLIARLVAEWQENDAWRSIAGTWGEFCTAYINLPEEVVTCFCEAADRLGIAAEEEDKGPFAD
jgi:hypothetical protein